ncbi:MAG: T9SS type A sorting domain-containing protein [Polaribacter sp.]|nr:T9SS type A sorting domain-containing protein [Polaribacter sp.]
MKKKLQLLFLCALLVLVSCQNNKNDVHQEERLTFVKKKKTLEEKRTATLERILHDFNMQKDPKTGEIPRDQKQLEFENALIAKENALIFQSKTSSTFISRGPSNLGGRTRAFAQDITDASGNTFLAGGVSGGMFRTTNGGASWVKVSPNDEIHNVTAIAQDPRPGFQNIWYYGTGEWSGNSASLASTYIGYGIWKSTNNGVTWNQIPEIVNNNNFVSFDSYLDFIIDLQVHPSTGHLFIGSAGAIYRFDGTNVNEELSISGGNTGWTDLVITTTGIVYAAIQGNRTNGGVWTSPTGNRSWTQIALNGTPTDWNAVGRITLAIAPSNENLVYALYNNGKNNNPPTSPQLEADLWRYNATNSTWTNYSTKLPDEDGATKNSSGNDPFSIQGGYDLVISVKPDNENFVVIGGTNIYKINNITTDAMFERRIGGYKNNEGYSLYDAGFVNHHPDIHALLFDKNNPKILYSGTDGGVHKTEDVTQSSVAWINLNNNYQTYQYYHVNMLNESGSDFIIGGAQDNGTTVGGISASLSDPFVTPISDLTTMRDYFGGDGASVAVTKSDATNYIIYASTQNGSMYRGNKEFLTANITPRIPNTEDNYPSKFVTYFHMDPDNPATIYYASREKLLRTTNAPAVTRTTWTDLGSLNLSERISAFETTRGTYNPASSFLLIGGEKGSIFKINDPQNVANINAAIDITPQGLAEVNIDGSGGQYVSDIAIHPTNNDIVMVTYSNYNVKSIFLTTNATSATPTWIEVERNLNVHSIRSAAITVSNGQVRYFIGTARGLYSSTNPTTQDWILEAPNTIGLAVVSGLVYRPSDNKLLVGTHGNGMYETTVTGTLSTNDFATSKVDMVLYPNPTIFELKFASNQFEFNDKTRFTISDVRGSVVKKGTLKDKTIDVSRLSKGVYFVQVNVNNKAIAKKFVKN